MRILIMDGDRVGLDFALRCADWGHEALWYRPSKKPIKDGNGFRQITIVDDWRRYMARTKIDLIVPTGNAKFLPELERFRDFGFPIFGPSVKSAELEIKRSVGMEAMKKAGIDVPAYKEFKSMEDAASFARKSEKSWVFKTLGDNEDKMLSFVSSDPAELVGWIERKITGGLKLKGPCMLQEKIDMEVELGVSGWFGPEGFLPKKWNRCFEFKKLMPGDIGCNTGEQGSVLQYAQSDKLADEMLMPFVPLLKKLDHRGDFAIGCGIDKKGKAWPFEFTCRLGWPAFYIQVASHKGDPAQWMVDLLKGEDTLKVSRDAAIGVVLAQPPYPYDDGPADLVEGNPISGIDEEMENLHLAGVMIAKGPTMKDDKVVDAPTYQTSSEYIMVATGLGKTVSQAMDKVYATIDNVKFPNMMYRNDIGAKLDKALPKLHEMGYCEGLEFKPESEEQPLEKAA